MTPALTTYLTGWYEKSRARQIENGKVFELTLEEFFGLWSPKQIAKLEVLLLDGKAYERMRKKNMLAWVLGWTSREAFLAGVMNAETALIQTRSRSMEITGMQKGDKHSQASKDAISSKLKGKPKSDEHNALNSERMIGKNKGRVMSQAEKDMRREKALARHARERGGA